MRYNKIYQNHNFMKLMIGNTISGLGDSMYNIALTVNLYQTTGSVSAIAFMWLIRAAMRIPVQFLAGIVADSYPRKRLICFTNLISAPISLAFLIVAPGNWPILYLLIFLLQALNDLEQPALIGLTQEIVEPEHLRTANAFSSFIGEITTFITPALAGGILFLWGVSLLFFINGISFLIAGIILLTIRYSSVIEKKEKREFTLFRFAKDGYAKAVADSELLLLLFIGILPGMMGRFYEIYKVHISDILLNWGAEGIVFFSYAMAIGGLLSPLLIKYFFSAKKLTADFYIVTVLLLSGILSLWGITGHPILNFGLLTIAGILFSLVGIIFNTYLQENTDKQYIGRIFSFYRILMILGAILAILLAPVLLNWWNSGLGFALVFGIASLAILIKKSLRFKQVTHHSPK